jgi:hypothetical protein
MPHELTTNESKRTDLVGRSGIYPASGPYPPGAMAIREQGALAHPEQRGARVTPSVSLDRIALGLGRALFGGYFLYNGLNHFLIPQPWPFSIRLDGPVLLPR